MHFNGNANEKWIKNNGIDAPKKFITLKMLSATLAKRLAIGLYRTESKTTETTGRNT